MKIRNKLLITFGALVTLIAVVVGVNFQTYKALENDASFVNYSGRLRATTYRMSLLASVIAENPQDDFIKGELAEAMEIFDNILAGIKDGDQELGLARLDYGPSIEKIDHIGGIWDSTFKETFNQVLSTGELDSSLKLNSDIREYTLKINEMVNEFSDYSNSKVMRAKIINGLLSIIALFVALISLYLLNKGIKRPIGFLTEDLKLLAQGGGDLTKRIDTTTRDEIAQMTTYFNQFIENIHEIVTDISGVSTVLSGDMGAISNTTEELTKSTEMIAVSAMDVAEGSELQNNQLEELHILAERLKNDIINVSQKAAETLRSSEQSQQSVEKEISRLMPSLGN